MRKEYIGDAFYKIDLIHQAVDVVARNDGMEIKYDFGTAPNRTIDLTKGAYVFYSVKEDINLNTPITGTEKVYLGFGGDVVVTMNDKNMDIDADYGASALVILNQGHHHITTNGGEITIAINASADTVIENHNQYDGEYSKTLLNFYMNDYTDQVHTTKIINFDRNKETIILDKMNNKDANIINYHYHYETSSNSTIVEFDQYKNFKLELSGKVDLTNFDIYGN